jgi:predicted anti-sigma-YlaC factor YlaD
MEHEGNCKEIFERLSQYLDLELAEADCLAIQEHLAGCPPCIEFAASLRKSIELCRQFQSGLKPAPLGQEARERLEAAYRKMLANRK